MLSEKRRMLNKAYLQLGFEYHIHGGKRPKGCLKINSPWLTQEA